MSSESLLRFDQLSLAAPVLQALNDVGYEAPYPIQAEAIPPLLQGRDLLGQAQTGTGKTAAFALPILSMIDLEIRHPQALVLTPTRELALQVAEAMQTYARHLKGFHVLPVYGGQGMAAQLRFLHRGVHAVVGTPGRVLDHLGRQTLKLDNLKIVVLDEADEMLNMGFLDDVEEILQHTPEGKQVALFSATMPAAIGRVANKYLKDPVHVHIKSKTATVATTSQRYWQVTGIHKLDALTRILEVEDFEGMLIFVRTRIATTELAEKLEARGHSAAPLSGDMTQMAREKTIERFRSGALDILVATDVAARGLDVERISHVVNYDIPYDTEAYVHRIGRTGRAGRKGEAILFVSPRELRMLRSIERATKQPITRMHVPSREDIADRRVTRFKQQITATLESQDLEFFTRLVSGYQQEHEASLEDIAAALACLVQQEKPLVPSPEEVRAQWSSRDDHSRPRFERPERDSRPQRDSRPPRERPQRDERPPRPGQDDGPARSQFEERPPRPERDSRPHRPPGTEQPPIPGTARYRIEVGQEHGVEPKNIVGAIANEAELESRHIGPIRIEQDHSLVDLPAGMPKDLLRHLKRVFICGKATQMRLIEEGAEEKPFRRRPPSDSASSDRAGDSAGEGPGGRRPFPSGSRPPHPGGGSGPRSFQPRPRPDGGGSGPRSFQPRPGRDGDARDEQRPRPRYQDGGGSEERRPPRPGGPGSSPGGFRKFFKDGPGKKSGPGKKGGPAKPRTKKADRGKPKWAKGKPSK